MGVNRYSTGGGDAIPVLEVDPALEEEQRRRLSGWRAGRDEPAVESALDDLQDQAGGDGNLLPPMKDAFATWGDGRRGVQSSPGRVRCLPSGVKERRNEMSDTRRHLVIIGGGPAGTQAATTAASKGGRVTLIEKEIVGGAAHLWDCIPSKTMAAAALRHSSVRNAAKLGLATEPTRVDTSVLSGRIKAITGDINRNWLELLESQSVEVIYGQGRFVSDREVVVETESGERRVGFDRAMVSTGSAPRIPEWAPVDGERVLTTRDCYDMVDVPEHMVIIGSGVTGVEFTHIFESLGSKVSLVVSASPDPSPPRRRSRRRPRGGFPGARCASRHRRTGGEDRPRRIRRLGLL